MCLSIVNYSFDFFYSLSMRVSEKRVLIGFVILGESEIILRKLFRKYNASNVLQEVKTELVGKNTKLDEATENAIWLKDNYGQNETRNTAVDKLLDDVTNEMDDLKEKLAEKSAQVELALYKKHSYEVSMDRFMAWCVSVDKTLRGQVPVSLRYAEIVIQQRVVQVTKLVN